MLKLCSIISISFILGYLPYSRFYLQGPNLCELCEMSRAHIFYFYSNFQLNDCSTHVTVWPIAVSCGFVSSADIYFPRHCPTTLLSYPFSYTYITTAKDGGGCCLCHRIYIYIYIVETVEFFCNKIQSNIVVNEVSLSVESIVNDSTSDTIACAVYMILHVVV